MFEEIQSVFRKSVSGKVGIIKVLLLNTYMKITKFVRGEVIIFSLSINFKFADKYILHCPLISCMT